MTLYLNNEEVSILQEILESELKSVEIEAIRSDKIEYHKMLQHRTNVIESILQRITAEQKSGV